MGVFIKMKEPTLVILAAGMGSRFGGLKQITAVDGFGHAIIDFSMYDAYQAGFRKVVFIIKHEIEEDFKKYVGSRAEKHFDVKYVFQEKDMLPEGYSLPEGRVKPWGTAHATLCAMDAIDGPFAVINADDFYGRGAYTAIYDYLTSEHPDNEHAMIGYLLKNTVTENGTVARGVCMVKDGCLTDIVERTKIAKRGENAAYTEDDGATWTQLAGMTPVSMNFWGFNRSFLDDIKELFPKWLDKTLPVNPVKGEFFLPLVADELIKSGKGSIKVLECNETWYGITYKEDMPSVVNAIAGMRAEGMYPDSLLD